MTNEEIVVLDGQNTFWLITIINGEGMIRETESSSFKHIKAAFPGGGVKISSIKKGEKSLEISSKSLQNGNGIYVWKSNQKEELHKCNVKSAFLRFA